MLLTNSEKSKKLVQEFGSPLFVYEQKVLEEKVQKLLEAAHDFHVSYAMKANCNNEILQVLRKKGITNVDCVSPGEIFRALSNDYKP